MSWGIVAYKRDAYEKSGFYVDFLSQFNLFRATGLFPYPLKTSGNQRFSDVFRGYRKRPVAWNGLTFLNTDIKQNLLNSKGLSLSFSLKNWIGPLPNDATRYSYIIIVIRNGRIFWEVVWIEYYFQLNLSSRRY